MENINIEEISELGEEVVKTNFTKEEVDCIKSEMNEKYIRLFAEFENFKKRTIKEKEEIKTSTKTTMLSSILDLDSDLAIASKSSKDEGIKLIMSKLEKFLNSQGVQSIQTETYDSELHEVISVLEIGEEKVIDVVSKGYTIGGVPFRYPKIILGK